MVSPIHPLSASSIESQSLFPTSTNYTYIFTDSKLIMTDTRKTVFITGYVWSAIENYPKLTIGGSGAPGLE